MDNFSNCVYNKGVNQKLQKQTIFPYERMKIMKKIIAFALMIAVMLSIAIPAVVNAAPAKVESIKQIGCDTNSVEFEWDALLGNNTRYYVELSTDGQNGWASYDYATGDHKTIYNLKAGRTYYVRVRASQDYGKTFGAWSDVAPVSTLPEKVENLNQTNCTKNSITLSWSKSDGATHYRVCEWVNDQEYIVGTTTKTSYKIKGVKNNVEFPYTIYVRPVLKTNVYTAEKVADYSWRNTNISASNIRLTPKKVGKPQVKYTYYSSATIEVTKVPFDDGYQFNVYNNKGKLHSSATNTGWWRNERSIDNIKRTEWYSAKVRAYSIVGTKKNAKYGPWSAKTYFSNGVASSTKAGSKKIRVSWDKVKGSTSYTVYISKTREGGYKKAKTVKKGSNSVVIKKIGKKKLTSNTYYYTYVVASKKVGKKTYKSTYNTIVSTYTK